MAVIEVRGYDGDAVLQALTQADAQGGGTVFLPAGTYALSAPLTGSFSNVCLLGDGDRASTLLAAGDFPPVAGHWIHSRIENLVIDAGGHGSPGLVVDLDKSYVRHCWIRNWSGYGISLNPNFVGLLNWIDDNFVEQCTGTGIHTTYQFYDSWIANNNVGSTGPNISVESGPVRILANHLNGAPRHNLELRGNKSLTIIGNICEGSRRESIVYTMPAWLEYDSPQVQIVGNNITNGGKEAAGRYPAIGIYSRDQTHRTAGFNITGNYIANEDSGAGWSYAVDAAHVDVLAIAGNQWDNSGYTVAPVRTGGTAVTVVGNTSGNDDTRRMTTITASATLTAGSGDFVCFVDDGADITLPSPHANTCRFTVKNIGTDTARVNETVHLGAGDTVEFVSDGSAWWAL